MPLLPILLWTPSPSSVLCGLQGISAQVSVTIVSSATSLGLLGSMSLNIQVLSQVHNQDSRPQGGRHSSCRHGTATRWPTDGKSSLSQPHCRREAHQVFHAILPLSPCAALWAATSNVFASPATVNALAVIGEPLSQYGRKGAALPGVR
ncbi:uncharacterized protein B0H18DRAFT_602427 [Fomitopsis serialis]|uniref:uncharacterized protein n=1 Tax=Fomitopsis serialis TaxID=139415 RepID=UPI002007C802|nr:uncharacterized protein B0H18DRAFT_602427 [Neoantrodia serialis]KAH9933810.1 hypothetical protein B0H18DRAFT_602427 [Neoantrodia serialis]